MRTLFSIKLVIKTLNSLPSTNILRKINNIFINQKYSLKYKRVFKIRLT